MSPVLINVVNPQISQNADTYFITYLPYLSRTGSAYLKDTEESYLGWDPQLGIQQDTFLDLSTLTGVHSSRL